LEVNHVGWGMNVRGEGTRPLTLAQAAARRRLDDACRCTTEERYNPPNRSLTHDDDDKTAPFAPSPEGFTPSNAIEAMGDLRHQLEAAQEELLDSSRCAC